MLTKISVAYDVIGAKWIKHVTFADMNLPKIKSRLENLWLDDVVCNDPSLSVQYVLSTVKRVF